MRLCILDKHNYMKERREPFQATYFNKECVSYYDMYKNSSIFYIVDRSMTIIIVVALGNGVLIGTYLLSTSLFPVHFLSLLSLPPPPPPPPPPTYTQNESRISYF